LALLKNKWLSQAKKQRRLFQYKRSTHLRRKIEDAQGDGKLLWKSLNSILSPPTEEEPAISPIALSEFFNKKTELIRESTKDSNLPVFDIGQNSYSLPAFDEVTPDEVEKLLGDSTTKQCELDIVPVWIIKTLRTVFAPILALLINISILQTTLPASHKRAIVRPRLKKPSLDPSDPASYRPVSNLSFISKLIERVIHRQLSTFVETNQLLPSTQSGFRRFHSTETAVVKVYNDIVTALDAGLITVLFLLDFSAAFDCVDPAILLQVLEAKFGVTASALKWLASFLTGRTQSVRVGSRISNVCNILFGVPQGSILGPLLFILYSSNITDIANRHGIFIHIYADDTQLYINLSIRDIEDAKLRLVQCFTDIQSWCASMRLKLNASKTELIWFSNFPKENQLDLSVQIDDNCLIEPSDVVRDLGVLLDNKLSMSNHISAVTKSCFFHLRRIRQIKRCLNESCLQTLVQALVISRLDYCNSVLVNLPDSTLHPYTTILHSAARLVKGLKPRDHITPALRQLHWLPVKARITYKICLLMYNINSGSCPHYMSSLVTPCSQLQSRNNLRSSAKGDYAIQRTTRTLGRRAFSVAGPSEWNKLPALVRQAPTTATFKTRLKTHLFKLHYD
jgi:Reverse transcriptase (RNA-dependent DNA polymerase)